MLGLRTSRLPPPVVVEHEGFLVVRDDIIPGGTKRRVLPLIFDEHEEYVYASPVQGYAQVALAYTARDYRKRATVFCAARKIKHPRTLEALAAGASLHEVAPGYLSVVQKRAADYCSERGAKPLPWGLDTPVIVKGLAAVARGLSISPSEVWCAAGSGTLCRALQLAWPNAAFNAVRVGAVPDVGNAWLWQAKEVFDDDAQVLPPFPSCGNYDAKVWSFVKRFARPGALMWNVAA